MTMRMTAKTASCSRLTTILSGQTGSVQKRSDLCVKHGKPTLTP